jgi:hypothetical protein
MTTTQLAAASGGAAEPRYKRKLRNYLIDVGLQIRYTGFIIVIAVFLTAVLGYKIFEAVRDTSKIITMTGLVDPATASELQEQFRENDRVVLWGIAGFGVVLVLSIAGAGIWMTHKVAGPLYSISRVCGQIRDNKLLPLRQLRKGDELQLFFTTFREMHEALRVRALEDVRVLGEAIATLEGAGPSAAPLLEELRRLRRDKEQSLEGMDRPTTT